MKEEQRDERDLRAMEIIREIVAMLPKDRDISGMDDEFMNKIQELNALYPDTPKRMIDEWQAQRQATLNEIQTQITQIQKEIDCIELSDIGTVDEVRELHEKYHFLHNQRKMVLRDGYYSHGRH